MFGNMVSNLLKRPVNDPLVTKRRHARHNAPGCVSMIGKKLYPVQDWSVGGVLINADGRLFGIDNELDITVKFKLRDDILEIPHRGRVVRKTRDKVAFEFLPLTQTLQTKFQRVIDDLVASGFSES